MHSVTIGRPVRSLASASRRRPSCPSRGARLVGAAAEHGRPGGRHRVGGLQRLLARLDRARAGDHREVLAADLAPGDLERGALVAPELGRGQLVGLEDGDDLLDARVALQAEAGDVLAVADGADHGHLFAAAGVGGRADGLDPLDDGLDLLVGGRRLHHDHHGGEFLLGACCWWSLGGRWKATGPAHAGTDGGYGARPEGPGADAATRPAERLAKSPVPIRIGRAADARSDAGRGRAAERRDVRGEGPAEHRSPLD